MWGKLAQGLEEHAGELRSGLAKLSDVVAPAVEEDEYEEEEYEEYEEEYLDGDEYYDEDVPVEHENPILKSSTEENDGTQKKPINSLEMQEKEAQIQRLEQRCSELESKAKAENELAKEKQDQIEDLERKCRDLESCNNGRKLQEKDDEISQLQIRCRELESKPNIEPKIVDEKNKQIQDLEQKCLTLEEESSLAARKSHDKDNEIEIFKLKCSDLQSAADRDNAAAKEKDALISQLEQRILAFESQEFSNGDATSNSNIDQIKKLEEKCRELQEAKGTRDGATISEEQFTSVNSSLKEKEKMIEEMQAKLNNVETLLRQREDRILQMQKEANKRMEEEENQRETQILKFKQEQAAMIEANSESISSDYQKEIEKLKADQTKREQDLQDKLGQERMSAVQKQRQLEQLLEENNARMAEMETTSEATLAKQENSMKQNLAKQERATKVAQQTLAETKSILGKRNEELQSLKEMVKELKAEMRSSKEDQVDYEEELEHLREENETLHHNWQVTEDENEELKKQLDLFSSKDDVISDLELKIQKLKDDNDRQKASIESKVEDAESSNATLLADRDEALSRVRDLEQQLAAAIADSEIVKCDMERIMKGNSNLNKALESFQSEREAEIQLLQEQHRSSLEAVNAAHAATMQATAQVHENKVKEVQYTKDTEVKNMKIEVEKIKSELDEVKKEKLSTRRSLDEAISRLQASQEDVIDRSMMKNVLLDWFARSGKSRGQVLEVMASLLHFSEEEKERIHLYGGSRGFSKVVESVATLPPAATDVKKLEGENVQDKWVNFLLAETEDS